MKASELRIGNYVNFGVVNEPIKILSINPSSTTIEMAQPIPITEEWLLKLGFVKHHKYGYFYIDFFIVDLDMNGQFYMCDIDIHIVLKHVHQLQNLYFACTGEELILEP